MRRVQMFVHISGGRGDGRDWPNAGEIIELGDEEAAGVVAAQLGRYEPDVEIRPAESAGDATGTAAASKPLPSAPKAAWVAYAVSNGMPREEAVAATKAELLERYG